MRKTEAADSELLAEWIKHPPASGALTERSRVLLTYALCGFANFGSLGILIGGLATMAPTRRDEIVGLGMRSIVSGTLATMTAGAVVGILFNFASI